MPTLDAARTALRHLLSQHVPDDEAEARDREAMIALAEGEGDCFSRASYRPGHFTGSAFVVCAATREVLLHHHRRLGRWLQLGGHDDGERDLLATALREAREESSLPDLVPLSPAPLDLDVHEIPAARGEPSHLHLDVRYALATRSPGSMRLAEGESLGLAWLTLEEAGRRMGEPGASRALARLARLLP